MGWEVDNRRNIHITFTLPRQDGGSTQIVTKLTISEDAVADTRFLFRAQPSTRLSGSTEDAEEGGGQEEEEGEG